MEKKNKILFGILILFTLIAIIICGYFLIGDKEVEITDAIRFRNEYMELNDKVNETNNKIYPNVLLNETNTFKYIKAAKVIDLLKNGTGVIYFGFNTCPWCRSLVNSLANVAEKKQEPIYYLDISNIRSNFEVENGKLSKIKDGTDEYYEILNLLSDHLEDFYLEDEEHNRYFTNEKRLYAPTLVAVHNGKITGYHVGTVESQQSGYDKLSNNQLNELEKIIVDLIESKDTDMCTQDAC